MIDEQALHEAFRSVAWLEGSGQQPDGEWAAYEGDVIHALRPEIERIVAERLAAVESVCAIWDAEPNLPPAAYNVVDDVRAALSTRPGTEGA